MTKLKINLTPEMCLLGILPSTNSKEDKYLMIHVLTAARLAWAQIWKTEISPSDEMVMNKIFECAEADRLTFRLKDMEDSKYALVWDKFYTWFNQRKEF